MVTKRKISEKQAFAFPPLTVEYQHLLAFHPRGEYEVLPFSVEALSLCSSSVLHTFDQQMAAYSEKANPDSVILIL